MITTNNRFICIWYIYWFVCLFMISCIFHWRLTTEEWISVVSSVHTGFLIACITRPDLNERIFFWFFYTLIDKELLPDCWIKSITENRNPKLILVCSPNLAAIQASDQDPVESIYSHRYRNGQGTKSGQGLAN